MYSGYIDFAKLEFKRLLSIIDREECSETYGCCDRTFWAWKFTDFAGSRFQETIFTCVWIYKNKYSGNKLFKSQKLLKWIEAGFSYWENLQHKDGSFDEAYPFERSLAATAFTSFYLSEAYHLISEELNFELKIRLQKCFVRSANWLCKNDEYHGFLSNHIASASAALLNIYILSGKEQYKNRYLFFLNKVILNQSEEGWYEEYGGADFGYQTHATFYLTRIWQKTGDKKLLESLEKSVKFLSFFVHPNKTIGGEYGSRNTSFYFPAAFEMLSNVIPLAKDIAIFMRPQYPNQDAAGLECMDSYNICPMINNYLFAHNCVQSQKSKKQSINLPFMKIGHWDFPMAGLQVHNTKNYQAIFSSSKGGVLKIYDKNLLKLVLSDCGYWTKLGLRRRLSSQSFHLKNKFQFTSQSAMVISHFVYINQKIMNPILFILFRLFNISIGKIPFISFKLKKLLVKVLVSKRKIIKSQLKREIIYSDNSVLIRDKFINMEKKMIKKLFLETKFSTIHMGSSRYFQYDENDFPDFDYLNDQERIYEWKK